MIAYMNICRADHTSDAADAWAGAKKIELLGPFKGHAVEDQSMNAVKGVVKNGHIVVGEPLDWPDGTEVIVEPITGEETFGVREEDWQDTPEAIAAWLRWFDSLEPLQMTPQEEAEWQAERQADKEREKAAFNERAEKLRRMWE